MEHHATATKPGNVIDFDAHRRSQHRAEELFPSLSSPIETKAPVTEAKSYRPIGVWEVWLQANAHLMVGG